MAVDVILHIYTHCTGALIQNGELGLVVEKSGHLHTKTETDTIIIDNTTIITKHTVEKYYV